MLRDVLKGSIHIDLWRDNDLFYEQISADCFHKAIRLRLWKVARAWQKCAEDKGFLKVSLTIIHHVWINDRRIIDFYRTRVRSLAMLVTNWLTHSRLVNLSLIICLPLSLTHWLTFLSPTSHDLWCQLVMLVTNSLTHSLTHCRLVNFTHWLTDSLTAV